MPVTSPTYQLSDAQYGQIKGFLPKNGHRGGQWKDHRLMIDGILWALSDGGRWRNVPDRFGPWQSVYDRFRNWTRKGLWDRILRHLQARKMHADEIDWALFAIDGTVIRRISRPAGLRQTNGLLGNQRTMPWDEAKAASARSFIWSATARARPWPSPSARVRSMRPSSSCR